MDFKKINFDFDYKTYAQDNNLYDPLGIRNYGDINRKIIHSIYNNVDPKLKKAYTSELDDLVRIHYLVRKLKIITALEIGSGMSTTVILDAINKNKEEFSAYVTKNLRKKCI